MCECVAAAVAVQTKYISFCQKNTEKDSKKGMTEGSSSARRYLQKPSKTGKEKFRKCMILTLVVSLKDW